MSRLLVTGSRHGWDHDVLYAALLNARLAFDDPFPVLVHGAAPGVDSQAARIWQDWGLPVEPHPADWSMGHKAGPIRNKEMVDAGADIALAFVSPDSRGTVDCLKRLRAAGVHTLVLEGAPE